MQRSHHHATASALLAVLIATVAAWPAVAAADTVAPVAAAPRAVPRSSATITAAGIPMRVGWSASDPSGIARYEAQVRIDGGSWATIGLSSPTARTARMRVPSPHEAQVRVRATDRAGNRGPWVEGDAFRVRRFTETHAGVTLDGAWSTVRSAGYLGGSALRTGVAGATATLAFAGSQVAWIGRRAPSGGEAQVSAAGSHPVLALLQSREVEDRRLLATFAWDTSAPRSVEVRAEGSGYAWLDGFVIVDPPASDPVLVGAGDIAVCGSPGDNRTARLLDGIAGRVFAAGDTAYPSGSAAQFRDCYGPTWGRWRLRTSPVPGNHEYRTAGAAGYFGYFGARAGVRGTGWYAYDLGAWRIYNLNANCSKVGCGPSSEQIRWLEADLAAHPRACAAAVWHQPLFSSGQHGGTASVRTLWQVLDAAGAELVLNGHDHDYERFAAQDADGHADPDGLVEFVVGTGGGDLRGFGPVMANSVVRDHSTHGVLKLTLRPTGYHFEFVPVQGDAFRDTGSGTCR